MNKQKFLSQLRSALSGLPQEDIEERLNFYSEMIDDYIEEGLSEEAAVQRIGSASEIASQILAEASPSKQKPGKKRSAWNITLLILGSPIWVSLLIAAFAVVFSLFVSLWAIIISFWSIFASLAACAFAGTLCGIGMSIAGYVIPGVAMIGASLVCAGLSIFAFYSCKAATKGSALLTKKIILGIKNILKKKEGAQNA